MRMLKTNNWTAMTVMIMMMTTITVTTTMIILMMWHGTLWFWIPKIFSSLSYWVHQASIQTRDKFSQMADFKRIPQLFIRVFIKRIQVHSKRARKQHGFLQGHSNRIWRMWWNKSICGTLLLTQPCCSLQKLLLNCYLDATCKWYASIFFTSNGNYREECSQIQKPLLCGSLAK